MVQTFSFLCPGFPICIVRRLDLSNSKGTFSFNFVALPPWHCLWKTVCTSGEDSSIKEMNRSGTLGETFDFYFGYDALSTVSGMS